MSIPPDPVEIRGGSRPTFDRRYQVGPPPKRGWWWRRVLLGAFLLGAFTAAARAETPKQAYADSLCQAVAVVWNSETKPGYRFDAFRCKPGGKLDGVQVFVVFCTQLHGLGRIDFAVVVMPDGTPVRAAVLRRYRAGPVA